MKLTINKYVAAVDDKPENGNCVKYSLQVEDDSGSKNIPDLREFDLIKEIINELLKE